MINSLAKTSARRCCALLLLAASRLWAGDFELGLSALEQGYTQQAIEFWKPLAELGDPDAQFGLGVIYNDAMGIAQDYTEANYWFLRAAEQGYAPAQYNLGNAYKYGTGLKQDDSMAAIWWRKSAEQDFGPAQYNLGSALLSGSGVPRDRDEGLQWYRRAAANGHPHAKLYLEEAGVDVAVDAPLPGPAPDITAAAQPSRLPLVTREPPRPAPEPVAAAPVAPAVPATRPAAPVSVPPVPAGVAAGDCRAWLEQGAAGGYTIQLMAAREESSATTYVQTSPLQPAPFICAYPSRGGIWYAVLHGQYANATDARAALAQLPKAVRDSGPYLRRLKELRNALQQ